MSKPNARYIQKIAHRHGVSYQRAVRIVAARGGRKSGVKRRKPESQQGQLL